MTWSVELSPQARQELVRTPKKHRTMIAKALDRMEEDPFADNVKPLKGRKWKGLYRKVVGRYRIFFRPDHRRKHVEVWSIRLRTEKTHR